MKSKCLGFLAVALVGVSHHAQSTPVTYNYTGQDFLFVSQLFGAPPPGPYTTSDSVTGSMTLPGPLADGLSATFITPTAFSFSDGLQTITNHNATDTFFEFWTGGSGQITGWRVQVFDEQPSVAGAFQGFIDTQDGPALTPTDGGNEQICGAGSYPRSAPDTAEFCALGSSGSVLASGYNYLEPGIWASEPGTLSLFGLGLGLMRRRRVN